MSESKNPKRVFSTDLAGAQNVPEGTTKFYANHVGMSLSPMDLRLAFSEMVGFEGDKLILEPMVFVTMSLPTAKALLHILATHLKTYEERFGTINAANILSDPEVKDGVAEEKTAAE